MKKVSALTIVKIIVLIILLAIIGYESVMLYHDQKEYAISKNEYEDIIDSYVQENEDETTSLDDEEALSDDNYPHLIIDFVALKKINPDFIGWLYFPALNISYPVVKENEIDQYLYRTFEGKSNKAGCIFMDVLSNRDFSGYSDMIFGHNMKNGTMFGNLKKLYKQNGEDVLKNRPYVYIYTEHKVYRYDIFSYYITKSGSYTYDEVKDTDKYDEYVDYAVRNSIYDSQGKIDFSSHPNLLTLSTCSGAHGSGQRFVVHTYRTKTWEN
ncbi:MAG: class B sortase [Butyrivibrio sp.]|nr:class B sortase [Butyrivibrio sp.]